MSRVKHVSVSILYILDALSTQCRFSLLDSFVHAVQGKSLTLFPLRLEFPFDFNASIFDINLLNLEYINLAYQFLIFF